MLHLRCTLPVLALYLLLEEISAAVVPSRSRNKREISWPEEELFYRLSEHTDLGDLSVGDTWDVNRDIGGRPSPSETFLVPTDHLSLQRQHHHRKATEKRRKVAPLDSIGSFQMANVRNPKDEPNKFWEDYWG
ncbi:hypothetical protein JOB18_038123 [Solea senegalensis]|uniref:Uncharacterized protein n=1 Tax=Solea senegalensis TaxID=28829 RepID=A0AAV6QWU1_SOLSE|nr:hypothetical protein JOB18_038123 [Solea senegalensis]